jgi:single-strand DNA-binding protein
MNNVSLIGRLTRDPELRYTQSGIAVVRFNIAVDRRMSKQRKREAEAANQQTADFINCTAWRQTAELIANYFKKGNRIGVTGRIQTGSYEKDGQTIYTTDVIADSVDFIESAGQQNSQATMRRPQASQDFDDRPVNSAYNNDFNQQDDDMSEDGFFPIDNDDIPF